MANVFLDNTIGLLLKWNGLYGLIVLTAAITLLVVVIYKYTSNQEALKKIEKNNHVIMLIKREGRTFFASIKLR